MKLIVVTSPTFFVEEDKILTLLFEEGLDILHLRKPDSSATYTERLLTLIPEKYHKRIVTHEHFYLKRDHKLMGIHLNRRNPYQPGDYSGHVSCSCHSVEELRERKHFFDYVFLRPIYGFDSEQRTNYPPETIRSLQKEKLVDNDVMAFGGITPDNILEIKDFGFGGAVVMDNLWNKFDSRTDRSYAPLIEHFRKLKEMAD